MSNIAFVDCLTSPKRITPPERIALPERLALRDALSALTQNGLELNSREGGEHGVLKQREIADERAGLAFGVILPERDEIDVLAGGDGCYRAERARERVVCRERDDGGAETAGVSLCSHRDRAVGYTASHL